MIVDSEITNTNSKSLQKYIKSDFLQQFQSFTQEIIEINHKKLIHKNVLSGKSFNIFLSNKNETFLSYDEMQNNLKRVKKENQNKDNFYIGNKQISEGDRLPIKFLNISNSFIPLPQNKFNLLMFSKYYTSNKKGTFDIFEYLLTKNPSFVSHLVLFNLENSKNISDEMKTKMSFLPNIHYLQIFDPEVIKLYRLLNIDSKEDFSFIIYNKNFEIICKGSSPSNNITFNEAEKIFYANDLINQKKRNMNDVISNLKELEENNENLVTDISGLKLMKNELKKFFNKTYLKSKCETIENCAVSSTTLSTFNLNLNQSGVIKKRTYKSTIEHNHIATMKNRMGQILEDFLPKFKNFLITNKKKNEELKNYLKTSCDYYKNIFNKLNKFTEMKFLLKKSELIGLTNYKIKYTIINQTPLNKFLEIHNYFTNIWSEYSKYYIDNKCSNELKEQVEIKFTWDDLLLRNSNYRMQLYYFNENGEEKVFIPEEGTLYLILLLKTIENYIFEEYVPIFPIIENFRKKNKNTKIEVYVAMATNKESINEIYNNVNFQNFLKFAKIEKTLFIASDTLYTEILQISSHLENICITPKGNVLPFGQEATFDLNFFLEKVTNPSKEYKITLDQYKDLKSYCEKLMRIKMSGLKYQPVLYIEFNKICNINLTEEKFELNRKYYDKNNFEYTAKIFIRITKKDKHYLTPFLNRIKQIINVDELECHESLEDCVDIPLGKICSQCDSADLGLNIPHFYCYFCNLHFCFKCGNNYKESVDVINPIDPIDTLPHRHYLVYIKVKNESGLKNIEIYKFGNNIFHNFNKGKEASVHSTYLCGICYNEIYPALRYICISCRPGPYRGPTHFVNNGFMDICPDCFDGLQQNKITEEKYLRNLEIEEHDNDSHVFLRVDFSTGEYKAL